MAAEGWSQQGVPRPLEGAEVGLTPRDLDLVRRLAKRLISLRPMRWRSLAGLAPKGSDLVDVERVVQVLLARGWVTVRHRRDRRGELQPAQLRLRDDAIELASGLLEVESPDARSAKVRALLEALQERAHGAPPVPERVLVRQVFGATKAVRVRSYRAELESALGIRLEELVRFHVDSVLTAGPVRYRFDGVPMDLRGSAPWMAVTEPVVGGLTGLELDGVDEVVCVENQTPFESLLYEGLAERAVVVFTSGFLGTVERGWLTHLVRAGVRRVRHWGDLDPWGLDIYRDLRAHVLALDPSVEVAAWRMEPELLERPETVKLTSEDWVRLHRYLGDEGVPLREVGVEMRRLGVKLEQEVLL